MNRTFHKLAALALVLTLPLASCDKKLDIEPETSIAAEKALQTSADVEAALAGAYERLGSEYLYGGALQYYADLLGDNGEIQFAGTYLQPKEIIRKQILTNNSFVARTWTDAYNTINITNTVLANLDKVVAVRKNSVEGSAKFIRGSLYFELVRYYAKAWNDGNPTNNPGVPLVLTPTNLTQSPGEAARVSRNTVAQVYAQAIQDLQDAERLLPGSNSFFATKYAASGMLSRVFLQQQRYAEAAVQANKVIASGNYDLVSSYAAAFEPKTNTSEDVFAIQLTAQSGTNDLNTFYSQNGRGEIFYTQDVVDLFDPNDDRLNLLDSNSGLSLKFENVHGNIHFMRLAEMYLTRAEGNFRAGTRVGATPVSDINTIRDRAGLSPVTSVTLNSILAERHLELLFEGFLLHDLKRNGLTVGSLPFSSPRLILPIPQREMDANPNLTQNVGY